MRTRFNPLLAGLLLAAPLAASAGDFETSLDVEPGGRLVVRLPGGSIEVDTHDRHVVEIDARQSGRMEIVVEQNGNEVEVTGKAKGWLGFLSHGGVRVHARVPERFDLDLQTSGGHIDVQELEGDVRAETSGGQIDVQEIRGDVRLHTSGGTVEAKEIVGDLTASTSGGSIRISEVQGRVELETSGGNIRVNEVTGHVDAETSGGSIEVKFEGEPGGAIETSGGNIEVDVPEQPGVDLHASTSGGRVELDAEFDVDGRVERGEARVRLNGGGDALDLRTSGGNIEVQID